MNKIEGEVTPGTEIDVKRFYLDGVVIESKCPKCGEEHERDLGDDYISHPQVGEPEEVGFWCDKDGCNEEWSVKIIIGISVRLAEPPEPQPTE